jgi:Domain of unknown function (DUF4287)/Domain of unknown function (DUF5655)
METYLRNAQEKTGKSWEEFRALAQEKGLTKHGEVMAWLKSEYGLGHGHATAVTHMVLRADEPGVSADDAVTKHFAGGKAIWRAPYDQLLQTIQGFGPGVAAAPTSSYISIVRGDKKIAVVQVTAARLDIGIKRKGAPADARFAESGAWNAMVTHRVRIDDPAQIDAEVIDWLRAAYEQAG